MTKKTFGSRNMTVSRRVMAVRTYHHFRSNCDWATIYWECGLEKSGERFLEYAKRNLDSFENYTEGRGYIAEYAVAVYDRWRKMVNREAWIAKEIENLDRIKGGK